VESGQHTFTFGRNRMNAAFFRAILTTASHHSGGSEERPRGVAPRPVGDCPVAARIAALNELLTEHGWYTSAYLRASHDDPHFEAVLAKHEKQKAQ
jgi:hypothetical protein